MNYSYVNEISWLFRQYQNSNLSYIILRNYNKLPLVDGHDIDIIIKQGNWQRNIKILKEMMYIFNLKLKKRIQLPYARRFYFLKEGLQNAARDYLILDFHFDEQWMGAVILKYEEIPKVQFKEYIVAREYMEPLLPFLTYLLSNKSINEKYFGRLVEYAHKYRNELQKIIVIMLGENLGNRFYNLIYNGDKANIKKISNKVRFTIWIKSFKKYPFMTVRGFIETIIKIIWYKRILKIYPP